MNGFTRHASPSGDAARLSQQTGPLRRHSRAAVTGCSVAAGDGEEGDMAEWRIASEDSVLQTPWFEVTRDLKD